jgi:hypothetical protein
MSGSVLTTGHCKGSNIGLYTICLYTQLEFVVYYSRFVVWARLYARVLRPPQLLAVTSTAGGSYLLVGRTVKHRRRTRKRLPPDGSQPLESAVGVNAYG